MATESQSGLLQGIKQMFTTASGRVFALICLMYFITYVDRVNVSTLAPMMMKDLHFSNIELGFALSVFGYPYALLQILGGAAADKFGSRKTLMVCGLIWGVATIATGMVGGLASLVFARLILGIGEGATFPAATRAMTSWMPEGRRGYAQGMVHSSSRLANAITPPLAVMFALYLGWRGAFVALGCASVAWVLVWSLYFRDNPKDHPAITQAEIAALPRHLDKATARAQIIPWGRLVRAMLPTTIVYFCYNWTLWLYITWLPSYFGEAYGLNLKKMALFSSAVFAAGVVGDTLGGVLTDFLYRRIGNISLARRCMIVFSLFASMLCLMPTLFVHNLTVAAFSLGSAFFFLELLVGPIWAVPMDIAPQYAGTASGIMNTGSAIAGIVSPFAFGAIIQLTHSYKLPFYGSVVFLAVGGILAFLYLPRQKLALGSGVNSNDGKITEAPVLVSRVTTR